MLAKTLLEQRAIFLQKLAFEILTNPGMRLATVANLAGDPTLFDKDLSSIISILFAHDNLKSENVSAAEQPIKLLEQIYRDLEVRGFKLPNFKRRYEWIKNTTGDSFRNNKKNFEGGEARALDRPLRRLRESFYELRMHDDGHMKDNLGRVLTKHTGGELTGLVENLIASVKKLETEGQAYAVGSDDDRAGKGRTQFLDQRYDEVAALINKSVGTSAEGPIITIYHLHGEGIDGERWYAVPEDDFPGLTRAVLSARPDWNADENSKWEYTSTLLSSPSSYQIKVVFPEGPDTWRSALNQLEARNGSQLKVEYADNKVTLTSPFKEFLEKVVKALETRFKGQAGLMRGARSVEQFEAEKELLEEIAQPSQEGGPIVRLVRLPFAPDQIDDAFPSVEIREDEYIGKHISRISLELIRKSRFSGFVEFDDKYRMMILWANAPSDDQKDADGASFREHLVEILKDHKNSFAGVLGQVPEVLKTKTGAALYFPKAASIPRIVKGRASIEKAIEAVNADIEAMEQHTRIERGFNRRIDEDELPVALEEVG
jgi:hypothetical protein